MLATYDFRCSRGHVFEALVEKGSQEAVRCRCGRMARRQFTVTSNLLVPAHMRAPGSSGSLDAVIEKDKRYRKSRRYVENRKQDDRIEARAERALSSIDKASAEAAPKLEEARRQDLAEERAWEAQPRFKGKGKDAAMKAWRTEVEPVRAKEKAKKGAGK